MQIEFTELAVVWYREVRGQESEVGEGKSSVYSWQSAIRNPPKGQRL